MNSMLQATYLGQEGGKTFPSGLDIHQSIPFRRGPVYLRLVTSASRALDYAAGGFHVAVDRMAWGGCTDHWEIHNGGTKSVACKFPLKREALSTAWNNAAKLYAQAFDAMSKKAPLADVIEMLRSANAAADAAFAAEGVPPPVDPVTHEPSAPMAKPWWKTGTGLGLAGLGLFGLGWLAFAMKDDDENKKEDY